MFTSQVHGVTEITSARIHNSGSCINDREGWVVLHFTAQNHAWSPDEEHEDVCGEFTFFFKDLELGLSQLRDALNRGERKLRKEQAEEIAKKEASL